MNKFPLLTFFAFLFLVGFCPAIFGQANSTEISSIVTVKTTVQYPNFIQPWRSKNPETRLSLGIYVGNGLVLCPSNTIHFATNIEIKKTGVLKNYAAEILKSDPDLGLALLKIPDADFANQMTPIKFGTEFFLPQKGIVLEFSENSNLSEKRIRVIKLDVDTYTNSYKELPFAEIQSDDKLEGNGELVLEETSRLPQGIVLTYSDQNSSGKMIPNFQIVQFLNSDPALGSPFPFKGFRFRPLLDRATRDYYHVKKEDQGVIVAEVTPNSSASNCLQVQDILMEVAGFKIDPKGTFLHPKYGKQSLSFLFHSGHEFGIVRDKTIPIKIIRNKKPLQVAMKLLPFPEESIRIPYGNTRNVRPKYLVLGGLVFLELSEQMLSEFGNQWRSRVDKKLLYLNDFHRVAIGKDTSRFVVLSQVLPLPGNRSYHNLNQMVLSSINGEKCPTLASCKSRIEAILKKEDFLILEFEDGYQAVFETQEIPVLQTEVLKKFQIPEL